MNRTSAGIGFIRRLLLIAAAMFCVCHLQAQNNPYKINDQLYRMYLDAYNYRTKPEGIAKARAVYDRAVELGDRKAQCIALTIPVIYYAMTVDADKFEHAVKALQDKARATGYEQYYYYGVTSRVNMLINQHRVPDAFDYISRIEADADKHDSMYGRYTVLNSLGQLHLLNSNQSLAVQCYESALKIGEEYLRGQDMAPQYRKISECYENLYDYERMLSFGERGFALAKSPISKLRAVRGVCYAAFMLGRYDTFLKYYDSYRQLSGHSADPKSPSLHEREIAILKFIYDRKFDEAEAVVNSLPAKGYGTHVILLRAEISRFRGDNAMCAQLLRDLYRGRLKDSLYTFDYAGLGSRITNQILETENQKLALAHQRLVNDHQRMELHNTNLMLANTRLSLTNSDLELQRTRSDSKIMRYNYSNKQLEAARLRSSIEAQRARQRTGDIIIVAIVVMIVVVAVVLTVFIRFHSRIMRRLRAANAELAVNYVALTEAKEHAEAANRAKTAFINSVGEDIRQPLHELVSHANAIADVRRKATPDMLHDDHKKVVESTDRLLAIVGDVLKKTQTTAYGVFLLLLAYS